MTFSPAQSSKYYLPCTAWDQPAVQVNLLDMLFCCIFTVLEISDQKLNTLYGACAQQILCIVNFCTWQITWPCYNWENWIWSFIIKHICVCCSVSILWFRLIQVYRLAEDLPSSLQPLTSPCSNFEIVFGWHYTNSTHATSWNRPNATFLGLNSEVSMQKHVFL